MNCYSPLACFCCAGIVIQQHFPHSNSYSCPGGPSLVLHCTFPGSAVAVLWSFLGTTITDDFPGHEIDNSLIGNGVSSLSVISSSYLKDSYHCIVIFPSVPPQELTETNIPSPASKLSHSNAMYKQFCAYQFICSCTFSNNSVDRGGQNFSLPRLSSCTFSDNRYHNNSIKLHIIENDALLHFATFFSVFCTMACNPHQDWHTFLLKDTRP